MYSRDLRRRAVPRSCPRSSPERLPPDSATTAEATRTRSGGAEGTVPWIESCGALDVLPGTALAVLVVVTAWRESGTGFDLVLDIVVPCAFDGPVARNDLAWLVGLGRRRAVGAAWHQRRRRLQQVLGELPSAGKQLLGY